MGEGGTLSATDPPIRVRSATTDDRPAILDLLGASLDWLPDDDHAGFYRWKHDENPFGASPAWVAVDGERVIGFRVFLRWEFELDGKLQRAVRAVDTATHPDAQGKGVFTRLTLHALAEMEADGVDFVFNTPNSSSGPGYLKMGWQKVGKLSVYGRIHNPVATARSFGRHAIADRWGMPARIGTPAAELLNDAAAVDALDRLLASQPRRSGLATRRSGRYLVWRFGGFARLGYQALLGGADVGDGIAFFRMRQRGNATEVGVGEVLAPGGDLKVARSLLRRIARDSGADYALRMTGTTGGAGYMRLPKQGLMLVWRNVCSDECPPLDQWRLTMGDAELF